MFVNVDVTLVWGELLLLSKRGTNFWTDSIGLRTDAACIRIALAAGCPNTAGGV